MAQIKLQADGLNLADTFAFSGTVTGAGGGDLSFGGDTFGANKVIGANDAYSLSLETSGNTALTIDANGIITKPLQPAFYAGLAASVDPNTDADYNPIFNTEIFDNNADYNTTNYTFTAPVTGRYLLVSAIRGYAVTTSFSIAHTIVSSNRNYSSSAGRFYGDEYLCTIAALADMDASDTAIVLVNTNESSFYITGGTYSYFHGHLVC